MRVATSTNVSALKVSFLVADHNAKAQKSFTIVEEELILPATKDICRDPFGEYKVKGVANVLLWATSITRRIDEIAEDVEAPLSEDK